MMSVIIDFAILKLLVVELYAKNNEMAGIHIVTLIWKPVRPGVHECVVAQCIHQSIDQSINQSINQSEIRTMHSVFTLFE